MCAYELSKRNLRVLLLEKEKLPRYKVCAGGLTKKAVDILLRIYVI
jgi:flavin-dependent dehydrogenase